MFTGTAGDEGVLDYHSDDEMLHANMEDVLFEYLGSGHSVSSERTNDLWNGGLTALQLPPMAGQSRVSAMQLETAETLYMLYCRKRGSRGRGYGTGKEIVSTVPVRNPGGVLRHSQRGWVR